MTDTPAEFAGRMDRLAAQFDERSMSILTRELGLSAKADAAEGFKSDLGSDLKMRNFPRRGKAMELGARYDLVAPTVVEVTPTPRSRGPIKMLEVGRTPRRAGDVAITIVGDSGGYGAGGMFAGPKIRRRKVKRNVGPMAPKHTWSDAREVIIRRYPSRLRDATTKALRRGLGG